MPFVLDLLRHGDALPAAADGDAARRLSPAGIATLRRLAERLAATSWRPQAAFTSPLLRARESAAIVLTAAGAGLTARTMAELAPDGDPAAVLATLEPGPEHVLMVGHQPLLGNLTSWLAGASGPGISPGTLVRIEFGAAPATGQGRITLRLAPGDRA